MIATLRLEWEKANPSLRAAVWLLFSGASLAAMSVVIRICATELHPFVIVFFRNLFSLLLMGSWIRRAGLNKARIGFYMLRAGIGLVSMLAWFYGVTVLPLSTATALNFMTPIFATAGAALLLNEPVPLRRWLAILVGFGGVLVITQPSAGGISGGWIILLSAAASGGSIVTIKFLSRTEPAGAIVGSFSLFLAPLSLIPALFTWSWPSPNTLLWLVVISALATLAQLFMTRAYALADASFLAPFEFGRLLCAAALGYAFFAERVRASIWIGAVVIIGTAAYAAQGERRDRGH